MLALDGARASGCRGAGAEGRGDRPPRSRRSGRTDLRRRRPPGAPHGLSRRVGCADAAGFRRAEPPVRGWWEKRFGEVDRAAHPDRAASSTCISRSPAATSARRIDHERLWSTTSEPFDLGGVDCPRPRSRGSAAAGVLPHRAGRRLRSASATRRRPARADHRCRLEDGWLHGPSTTASNWCSPRRCSGRGRRCDLDADHGLAEWSAALIPDDAQARALDGYDAAARDGWGPEGRSVLAALGPFDRIRFIAGLALPSRASLRRPTPDATSQHSSACVLHCGDLTEDASTIDDASSYGDHGVTVDELGHRREPVVRLVGADCRVVAVRGNVDASPSD